MTKQKILRAFERKQIPRPIQGQFSFNTMIYTLCTYNYISQVTLTDIHLPSKEDSAVFNIFS